MNGEENGTRLARMSWFLREGQWGVRAHELPAARRMGLHTLRLVSLVAIGFRRNQCALHAASLTFFSLMALVPILVLGLALARTFGGADMAKTQLDRQLDEWLAQAGLAAEAAAPDAPAAAQAEAAQAEAAQAFSSQVREVADRLFEQVNSISFGTLGGVGLVMLLWSVVGTLGKVEDSFNQVWGVERPRQLVRKVADYLFVIMILPFLIMAVSTVPVASMVHDVMHKAVGESATASVQALTRSGVLKTVITLTVGSLTFAFLLGFMPNTRVKVVPALAGGFVTLVLFAGWLKLCAMLQVGIAKYSALYGGFAVLPILLMWVYTSWQIVLLGSEIAFAVQNRDTYMLEQFASGASVRARLLLAVALCGEAARRAREPGGGPFAAEAFARKHGIPHRFVRDILDNLMESGLLAEVAGRPGEYLLCRCGGSVTVAEVARALLDQGEQPGSLGLESLEGAVNGFGRRLDAVLGESFGAPVAEV